MENTELFFDEKEFTYFLYGGQLAYEQFLKIKTLKEKYDFLKFRPETYAYEPEQHLAEEGKVLLELIQLHKSNKVNLQKILPHLQDLTPYSRSLETHFGIFKNLVRLFASPKSAQALQKSIDSLDLVGSVLLQEMDFNRSLVEDTVDTTATFDSATGKFYINTPAHKAKLCRFFTPHSTHVIVFARVKTSPDAKPTPAYPFFIPFRNTKTLELTEGITTKWLGPSYGGVSGREFAFEFKNVEIDADKILLDRCITYNNQKLEVLQPETFEFTTKLALLMQQDQHIEKSLREGLKAAYLTIRHSNNRTQFKTLDEKGKERPIFDYDYNKKRIMKGFCEIFNLNETYNAYKKRVLMPIMDPVKNFELLNDIFIFYDMFEVYVNERCLIAIEAFRESLGGIGFLKYSGIPTLQENAMKNATYTNPLKEIRYLKFAQFFANIDFMNPGPFVTNFASWLFKTTEFNKFADHTDFHQNFSFFGFFFSTKIFYYQKRIFNDSRLTPQSDPNELLKKIPNFDDIATLCESFISYMKTFSTWIRLGLNLNRPNKRLILFMLAVDLVSKVQEDVPFYLSQEGSNWPKDSYAVFAQDFKIYVDALGSKSIQIINSLGFDEDLLHSCIAKTADETYEKVLNMSKNHNPRNDPKVQDDIRAELLKFLNRPNKPKL